MTWEAAIETETYRVRQLASELIEAYLSWPDYQVHGVTHNTVYGDLVDFVNFRVETAVTCLDLGARDAVADALGLTRSLLEHYLLLMLMVRGTKFFRLRNLEDQSPGEFRASLVEAQEQLESLREAGDTACLEVGKYPRAKRHLMYVYEGLRSDDGEDFVIPVHYFHFRDFHPEAMRLKPEDYFQYYEPGDKVRRAFKDHRSEAAFAYRHFLSYDALIECLKLNDLLDDRAVTRVEAHYTFLGRFLHPTHDAARNLHERSNYYAGQPAVGMTENYTRQARRLSTVYVTHLLADTLEESASSTSELPTSTYWRPARVNFVGRSKP